MDSLVLKQLVKQCTAEVMCESDDYFSGVKKNAARPAGATMLDATIMFAGSILQIDTKKGNLQIELTPEQIEQIKVQLQDLTEASKLEEEEHYDQATGETAPGPRDRTEPVKKKKADIIIKKPENVTVVNKPQQTNEGIKKLIKECVCEVLQDDLTDSVGQRYKSAIYSALKQYGFQSEGNTPNDYVTHYVYNFATLNVEINLQENAVKLDVFFDSERMAQNNKIEEYEIPPEYDNEFSKKIVLRALKIKVHLDDNSAVFAGSDDMEEGFDPTSTGPNPEATEGTQDNPYPQWNAQMRRMEEGEHGRYAQEAGAGEFDPRTFGVNP